MAWSFDSFILAIEQAIGAAWPEVLTANGGGGIWEVDKVSRIDFERLPAVPYAVIEWNALTPAESPITPKVFEAPIALHYTTGLNTHGGIATVRTQLWALCIYLTTTGLSGTAGDVLAVDGFDWSGTHPANQVFIQLQLPFVAGSMTVRFSVGD